MIKITGVVELSENRNHGHSTPCEPRTVTQVNLRPQIFPPYVVDVTISLETINMLCVVKWGGRTQHRKGVALKKRRSAAVRSAYAATRLSYLKFLEHGELPHSSRGTPPDGSYHFAVRTVDARGGGGDSTRWLLFFSPMPVQLSFPNVTLKGGLFMPCVTVRRPFILLL